MSGNVRTPGRVQTDAIELASAIQERWSECGYDEDRFAEIAETELHRWPIGGASAADILEWLATTDHLPFQPPIDENFGKPHLTVWWSGRFQVDVLFWDTATTDVHQHAFSGAFKVLAGSSVHSIFHFEETGRPNASLLLGRVKQVATELLTVGEVRRIGRGRNLIHSLFHIESPSATLVVKTCGDPSGELEYAYYPPALALDVSGRNTLGRKQLQAVDLLLESRGPHLEPLVSKLLATADGHTCAMVLIRLCAAGLDPDVFARLALVARERHGAIVEAVLLGAEGERSRRDLKYLRQMVRAADHRLLLALAVGDLARSEIERIVLQRHPGSDPADLIARWIDEIGRVPSLGSDVAFRSVLSRLPSRTLALRQSVSIVDGIGVDPDPSGGQRS